MSDDRGRPTDRFVVRFILCFSQYLVERIGHCF